MTRSSSSFRVRLALGAALWISIGFFVSWLVLTNLLRGHVLQEFSSELDHHAIELAELAEIDPAGGLSIRAPLSDFRFNIARSGYYWQVSQTQGATLVSTSMGSGRLPLHLDPAGAAAIHEGRMIGPSGEVMLLERRFSIGQPTGPTARVVVAMDMSLVDDQLQSLESTLAIAMACLGSGLIVAAFAQIGFALRPLARIDQSLLSIGRGEARRMPLDVPREVLPLVEKVNAVLDKNEDMIQRARLQAGNLAHALKSSLAHLQIEAEKLTRQDQGGAIIQAQCDIMRRQIDYQLARARATASRNGGTHATPIGPVIENVVAAMRRLHLDRPLTIEADRTSFDASVACGSEDLEEVLGNLIDNAAKWAASRVLVSVTVNAAGRLLILVEDDGPGMPPDAHERVFRPGERLDESAAGSGLGLAIARDVVDLYGGRLGIGPSRLGGAGVVVELDRPA